MSDCKKTWDDPKFDPVARKNDHIKKHGTNSQERKPREECPECGEEIYLKWGPIITHPYWSHNRAINDAPGACRWQPNIEHPESEEHIKGKQIACELLNRGLLKIETRCSECGAHEIADLPRLIYRTEVTDTRRGACRWDIAGLNAEKEVVVGVEIKQSHETDQRLERRSHVWWGELSASDLLWHEDIDEDDDPVTVRNRRARQICLAGGECRKRVAEKLRVEKEEADRKRVEQERLIKEREERRQKRLDWSEKCGYIDKDNRFTDLVVIDPVKGEIKALTECIRCGEDREHSYMTPFCLDCREEVTEYDRKFKLEPMGRASGIFDGKWIPPTPTWSFLLKKTKETETFWLSVIKPTRVCAICQKRNNYKIFPYCQSCCPELKMTQPKREIEATQPAPPTPAKKIRRAEEDNIPQKQPAQTLDPLSLFMGNREYGPLLGITPTQRYLRAKRFECQMTKEIVDFFEKMIEEKKINKN